MDAGARITAPSVHMERRRVHFAPDVKGDGPSEFAKKFAEYMENAFRKGKRTEPTVVEHIARQLDVPTLLALREMLLRVMQRCENKGRSPTLLMGSPKSGTVMAVHLPYLQTHVEYLDQVVCKVRALIAQRAAWSHDTCGAGDTTPVAIAVPAQ